MQISNRFIKVGIVGLLSVLIFSCNSTKRVPDGNYLLSKNIINHDVKSIQEKDIHGYLKQKPNKRILGFRFHLWLYNRANPDKKNGLNNYLRKIGEEPVIYDSYQTTRSVQQIKQFLQNKGYYHAQVSDTVIFKRKFARVHYNIHENKPYRINKLTYFFESDSLQSLINADSANCLIKTGKTFDMDVLQAERTRIEVYLRNNGFYYFSKDLIYFEADTNSLNLKVDLAMHFRKAIYLNQNRQPYRAEHRRYNINNVTVTVAPDSRESVDFFNLEGLDTISHGTVLFKYKKKLPVKPSLLANKIFILPETRFKLTDIDETYKHLNSLRVFKYVNISFKDISLFDSDSLSTDSIPLRRYLLNCNIQALPTTMQSYKAELEVTHSAGDIGFAASLNYQHKNLVKGAEMFEFKIRGAYETLKQFESNTINYTFEMGAEANLLIPGLLMPFTANEFSKKHDPKTNFSVGYVLLRRPDYWKTTASSALRYIWKYGDNRTLIVYPIDLTYVKLPFKSDNFSQYIDTTFLKYSYYDHFVTSFGATFLYNNQSARTDRPYVYWRSNIETAGNVFSMLDNITTLDTATSSRNILGNVFYQYVKAETDVRYYKPIYKTDRLVYRFYIGAGLPYGNSRALPFEKMFFSGGSTGIRAWQVRTLGPGSLVELYKPLYPDRIAEMKIETNFEYRFNLIKILEGALFFDAGNIWDISKREGRDDAVFKLNNFYNQIAIGGGAGLRLNLNFFIFRLDLGMKLRDPQYPEGKRWTVITDPITWTDDFNLTIGIGYPF